MRHSASLPHLVVCEHTGKHRLCVDQLHVGVVEQVVDAAAEVAPDAMESCATLPDAGAVAGAVRSSKLRQDQIGGEVCHVLLYAPHRFLRDAASVVQVRAHLLTAVCAVVVGKKLYGGIPALNLVAPLEELEEAAVPGGLRFRELCQSRWRAFFWYRIDVAHFLEREYSNNL